MSTVTMHDLTTLAHKAGSIIGADEMAYRKTRLSPLALAFHLALLESNVASTLHSYGFTRDDNTEASIRWAIHQGYHAAWNRAEPGCSHYLAETTDNCIHCGAVPVTLSKGA